MENVLIATILGLAACPIFAVLIGNALWNWGSYSRWHGYHPRTEEAWRACIREMRDAEKR